MTEGKEFPDNSLIVGSPAKVVRTLTDEQADKLRMSAAHYVANAARHRDKVVRIDAPSGGPRPRRRAPTSTARARRGCKDTMSELQKFIFDGMPVRGMIVRLTDSWQEVLRRRSASGDWTPAVRDMLGQMAAAATLMQANLKFNGALILQVHGDGPVKLAVAEAMSDLRFRVTAKVQGDVAADARFDDLVNRHGEGRCAITLDPLDRQPGQQPYQGVVPLESPDGGPVGDVATMLEHYMRQSEQLETRIVLAADGEAACGLLIQRLPIEGAGNLAGAAAGGDRRGGVHAHRALRLHADRHRAADAGHAHDPASPVLGGAAARVRAADAHLRLQLLGRPRARHAAGTWAATRPRHPGRARRHRDRLRLLRHPVPLRRGGRRRAVRAAHQPAGRARRAALSRRPGGRRSSGASGRRSAWPSAGRERWVEMASRHPRPHSLQRLRMNRQSILASPATPRLAGAARRRRHGFTLIELMVTIAIAAILVGLSASPISQMMASNRVQTEASSLVADLMYARSEAVRRGRGVTVCASSNGSTCTGLNNWAGGWIVFSDPTQCSTVPTGAQMALRTRPTLKGGDTFKAIYPTGAANSCISFNRDGMAASLGYGQVLFAARNSTRDDGHHALRLRRTRRSLSRPSPTDEFVMHLKPSPSRAAPRGFTLVELLVTLHRVGRHPGHRQDAGRRRSRNRQVSRVRSLMIFQAESLAGSMRANRSYWAVKYATAPAFTVAATGQNYPTIANSTDSTCLTTKCSPAEMVYADLKTWRDAFVGAFPGSTGTITCVSQCSTTSTGPAAYDIKLSWNEKSVAVNRSGVGTGTTLPVSMVLHVQP